MTTPAKEEALVTIASGRNDATNRRTKLIKIPAELFDEIEQRSEGPLNQVLVELINKSWVGLKKSGKTLSK